MSDWIDKHIKSQKPKTMDIMCCNESCDLRFHPVNVPKKTLGQYQCKVCEGSMKHYNENMVSDDKKRIKDTSKGKINSKKYLDKFGLKDRGDFSVLAIFTIVLGPGTLVLISWALKPFETYGTRNFVSNFLDSIFGSPPIFIVFIYLVISTLCAMIWWGFLLIEKITSKKD